MMDKFPSSTKLQEPFSKLFEKASSLFGLSSNNSKAPALDGEIVYSKNNVCVHSSGSNEPVPGYLSLRCSRAENQRNDTLILHWVPNVTIRRNPQSVDSPIGSSRNSSSAKLENLIDNPADAETLDASQNTQLSSTKTDTEMEKSASFANAAINNSAPNGDSLESPKPAEDMRVNETKLTGSVQKITIKDSTHNTKEDVIDHKLAAGDGDASIVICSSKEFHDVVSPDRPSSSGSVIDTSTSSVDCSCKQQDDGSTSSDSDDLSDTVINSSPVDREAIPHKRPLSLSVSSFATGSNVPLSPNKGDDNVSTDSGSTGGPDSVGSTSPSGISDLSSLCDIVSLTATAEMIAESRKRVSANTTTAAANGAEALPSKPSVFSVNLGTMRSLRLFFTEGEDNCGQLVIASRESQYKIFHFYNGGLDKLTEILQQWNLCCSSKNKRWSKSASAPFTQLFQIVRPKAREKDDVHPEESLYQRLDASVWRSFMNEKGQICDEVSVKKTVFFGGIESSLRKEVWPFLLHYYPYDSTYGQREQIRNERFLQYQKIRLKRLKFSKNEAWSAKFWRSVQNIVEKDVVRTDRSHAFYKGEGNPNVGKLKEILLNYAVAHPHLGYTQGMSDLLSPVLVQVTNESDAYWCFVGLMQRTIFNSRPKDLDMDKQLLYLKELLRIMHPKYYNHLMHVGEAEGLLFVHRWILLCFKREFSEEDALSVWETCWANIQTDYFHLFIALAIIHMYADDVLNDNLPADEMLLHFSSLSHNMDGAAILAKARALTHQFRLLETTPCTLQNLCSMGSAGMWDSGHAPAVECVGHQDVEGCPNLGFSPTQPIADIIHGLVQ